MHLSDAITRLSTHDKNVGKTIKDLNVSIHSIAELTGFNSLSVERLGQHTSKYQSMQLLIDHINSGFPESSTKCCEVIQSYFSFRDEVSVCNGIILKGNNRIVIPESLRPQAINILHNKAHLRLSKVLERAHMCIYWPGTTDIIKDSVSACKTCLTHSDRQQRELYISDVTMKPWSLLSLDNFEFQGSHYLMVLDTAKKFCVIWSVPSLNTETMIQTLTSVFSEQGLPHSIRCDWGKNFVPTILSTSRHQPFFFKCLPSQW